MISFSHLKLGNFDKKICQITFFNKKYALKRDFSAILFGGNNNNVYFCNDKSNYKKYNKSH